MATFTPPFRDGRSMVGPPGHPLNPLMRYWGAWATGATVWKDSLGAWHESIAPYEGGATQTVHNGSVTTVRGPDEGLATAQVYYLGGHVYTITEAAADELEALGYEMLTRESIAESFTKANGALGPDLEWRREVFDHAFEFAVVSNRAVLSANTPGTLEDLWVPTPNTDSPDVVMSLDVTDLTRGLGLGAGDYVIDVGAVVRGETRTGGTNYRGYAAGIGRNNIFFPPANTWHLGLFRVDGLGTGGQVLLDLALGAFTDVVLPGVFTFTADGPNLSATFTHSGPGAALSVDAVDATYLDGWTGLGGSVVVGAGDSGSIEIDNFEVGPT